MGFKNGKAGAVIQVRVTTRSANSGITGVMDDGTVKIRLSSAPVGGKANEELIKILSKVFNCPKTNIEIISGLTQKEKLVAIYGLNSDVVNQIIDKVMNDSH